MLPRNSATYPTRTSNEAWSRFTGKHPAASHNICHGRSSVKSSASRRTDRGRASSGSKTCRERSARRSSLNRWPTGRSSRVTALRCWPVKTRASRESSVRCSRSATGLSWPV
uniref:(northern house mosquito) hypothetical protein n=1 Tax=Culex pipiens TaxID=7175 RepID=A0A8D8I7R5_CULPI